MAIAAIDNPSNPCRWQARTYPVLATERWDVGGLERLELADLKIVISEATHDLRDADYERLDPECEQLEALKDKRVLLALQYAKGLQLDVVIFRCTTSIIVAVDLRCDHESLSRERGVKQSTVLFVFIHDALFAS